MEGIEFIYEQIELMSDVELHKLIEMVTGELGRRSRERLEVEDAEPS